ncbi:MAG: aldo/keto reductase [Deltaproteobacteria bacterium]|nr:aldo/keto reductase [Deltaproteobacteria bacterium]
MEYTTLGRTGLKVSVAGLGCGGPSRLGMRGDAGAEEHAVRLIKQALDLGVNFLDTAQNYGTEGVVGKAIAGRPRDQVVISTKITLPKPDDTDPAAAIFAGVEKSLRLLGTDYIDIYHLHGVEPKDYQFAQDRLIEPMRRLKEQGKIRFIGVTEGFVVDTAHTMLEDSLKKNLWDVVMVGFSLLNPSARKNIFPLTLQAGVGVLDMFAVRRALSQTKRLMEMCAELVEKGTLAKDALELNDPLGFLLKETDAATLPEAAYRFCRHEQGVDVVLTGTGNLDHLNENLNAITKPPLPKAALAKLDKLFGDLDTLTGN